MGLLFAKVLMGLFKYQNGMFPFTLGRKLVISKNVAYFIIVHVQEHKLVNLVKVSVSL